MTFRGSIVLIFALIDLKCDPFSAELYRIGSSPSRGSPALCNSTVATNSTKSNQAVNSFCSQVWGACQNVSMSTTPFTPSQGLGSRANNNNNTAKLADVWQSETDFCNAFGAASSDDSVCFDGGHVTLNRTGTQSPPPSGMCLEKIGNGSYLNLVPHPKGSNRAFFSNQPGVIWLATIPAQESGGVLGVDESNPFLDLSDQATLDTEFGMMGISAHPEFLTNGRFFVSYNCDKTKVPECGGRCSCNSEVNCDPASLPSDSGSLPCQFQSVVAEYTVNGTLLQLQPNRTIFWVIASLFNVELQLQPKFFYWTYSIFLIMTDPLKVDSKEAFRLYTCMFSQKLILLRMMKIAALWLMQQHQKSKSVHWWLMKLRNSHSVQQRKGCRVDETAIKVGLDQGTLPSSATVKRAIVFGESSEAFEAVLVCENLSSSAAENNVPCSGSESPIKKPKNAAADK